MLSVRDAEEREHAALKALAKATRALLECTTTATINLDGRSYYHLTTFALLEIAQATRDAEEIVRGHE